MVAMQPRQSQSRRDNPDGGAEVLAKVKEQVVGVADSVRQGVRTAGRGAKQALGEMSQAVSDTLSQEAERLFDKKKGEAASKVARVGKLARQAAHAMHAVKADAVADYLDDAAGRVEKASSYIKERSLGDVLQEADAVAREHEALAVAGLFVGGFLLARFLKASGSRPHPAEEQESTGAGSRNSLREQDEEGEDAEDEDESDSDEHEDEDRGASAEDAADETDEADDADDSDEADDADDSDDTDDEDDEEDEEEAEDRAPTRTSGGHPNGRDRGRH